MSEMLDIWSPRAWLGAFAFSLGMTGELLMTMADALDRLAGPR